MITPRLWRPCDGGYPDPENCPRCTPPADERCPEFRESIGGLVGNDASAMSVRRHPCRVLGPHDQHNDGMGTVWVTLSVCGVPCPNGGKSARKWSHVDLGWMGHCNRPVREQGQRCWQHQGAP